jgi:hypothetical protein
MDNMEKMMQQILAQINSGQEKAEASMAKLEKIEETMECQMKHLMMAKWNIYQETTEIDPDTEMMQTVVEHQEFPMGEAVVRPVRGLSKWRRVRKLAADAAKSQWN